nr:hypothetical protein [Trichocoleus desertorum]
MSNLQEEYNEFCDLKLKLRSLDLQNLARAVMIPARRIEILTSCYRNIS